MANPLSHFNLEAVHLAVGQVMADVGAYVAEDFKRMLSDEGSGEHWWQFDNPNRSSTTREYPALQKGNLADSVGLELPEYNRAFVGFMSDENAEGFTEAEWLENMPPSQGGRQPIGHYLAHGRFSNDVPSDAETAVKEAIDEK